MRIKLANELADTINEFGPKVFEDFNEVCIFSFSGRVFSLCILVPYHGTVCECPAIHWPTGPLEAEEQHGGSRCAGQSARAPDGQYFLSSYDLPSLGIVNSATDLVG